MEENKKQVKVKIIKEIIRDEENGMPYFKLQLSRENSKRKIEEFLYPFRGYTLGIYGKDGQGEYASSPVLGLGNIVLATQEYNYPESNSTLFASNSNWEEGDAAKQIIYCMVLSALMTYRHRINLGFSAVKNNKDIPETIEKHELSTISNLKDIGIRSKLMKSSFDNTALLWETDEELPRDISCYLIKLEEVYSLRGPVKIGVVEDK